MGTYIESSWSTNGKEKDIHSYNCIQNKKYSSYINRSYRQNDCFSRHYNNYSAYQPQHSNNRSHQ